MRSAAVLIITFLLSAMMSSTGIWAESPDEIWKSVMEKWEDTDNLTCDLFAYVNDQRILKKADGTKKTEKSYVGIYALKYTFKKPNKLLMEFSSFKDTKKGKDLISKIASDNPGLIIVFGYLNTEGVYAKFPPQKEDTMGLNVHIKNNIFQAPSDFITMESVDLSLVHTLGDLIKLRYHYFDDGTVTVKKGKYVRKTDFDIVDGKGAYKETESKKEAYVLTFVPDDPAENNDITKEFIMIDPELYFPVQAEVYRGDDMIYCLRTENVKLNPGITDEPWKKFYKGAKIVKTQSYKVPK